MFIRFVCSLLSFRARNFPENPKPKNPGNLLYATRIVQKGEKYIVWELKLINAHEEPPIVSHRNYKGALVQCHGLMEDRGDYHRLYIHDSTRLTVHMCFEYKW